MLGKLWIQSDKTWGHWRDIEAQGFHAGNTTNLTSCEVPSRDATNTSSPRVPDDCTPNPSATRVPVGGELLVLVHLGFTDKGMEVWHTQGRESMHGHIWSNGEQRGLCK